MKELLSRKDVKEGQLVCIDGIMYVVTGPLDKDTCKSNNTKK
jgi:hypothetical protein